MMSPFFGNFEAGPEDFNRSAPELATSKLDSCPESHVSRPGILDTGASAGAV